MSFMSRGIQVGGYSLGIALLVILLAFQTVVASPTAQSVQQANPDFGKALFIDDVNLANGGPACIGCHSINQVGILGGGVLGPDLTNVVELYGESGLRTLLTDISLPTMQPVFEDHPLTADEVEGLVAFLVSTQGQPQSNKDIYVLGLSVAGFLGAMVLAAIIWRGRLRRVRARMVEQTHSRK